MSICQRLSSDLDSFEYPVFPSFFPAIASALVQKGVDNLEQTFKQPTKQIFPYPIDIKKVYDRKNNRIVKLVFNVALAGIDKNDITVQIKNRKFLCIKIEKQPVEDNTETDNELETIVVSKGISYRNAEINYRIVNEIDFDKFKPTFNNGLLEIELYFKYNPEDDVIEASFE